jgi:hypothetical protein
MVAFGTVQSTRTINGFIEAQVELKFGKVLWLTLCSIPSISYSVEAGETVICAFENDGTGVILGVPCPTNGQPIARLGDSVQVSTVTGTGTITSGSDNIKA